MRAAALKDGTIYVNEDAPEPKPETGQVLVEVCACGICGSDLHFAKHGATMMALGKEMKGMGPMAEVGSPTVDLSQDVWMGHEFSAKVLDAGPDTQTFAPDTIVTSIPILLGGPTGVSPIVYSNTTMGGYAERMLLSAMMLVEVPNGLDPKLAALTEPMAVGAHAVAKSGIKPGDAAVVLGCGPIGLAVIGALRIAGIEPIVAADFSPARRKLATPMGAHEAVDPKAEPAIEAWQRVDGQEPLVIFECVGVKGMLADVMAAAPQNARIVVAGVCLEPDTIQPLVGINKELSLQFVLGYTPEEFSGTLQRIASGDLDVVPLITGEVGIAGVPAAFEALRNPDEHAKILVEPALG